MKDLLNRIAVTLSVNDYNSEQLWWILSALRGPDSGEYSVKYATTAVIRAKMGILVINPSCDVADEDTKENVTIRLTLPNDHFGGHARQAFKALGLKWDKVNQL